MMLATGMLLWFAKNPSRHLMLLLSALTIMLLVRPHMALMFLIALGVGNILTGRMSLIAKIGFTFLSVLLVAFLLPALMDLFNIGSDLNDIAQYIESRQEIIEGGSSIILSEMVWPARLFAFLFRPLIFEGGNAIALVAGIENTILVTFMLLILLKARKGFRHDPDLPGKMVLLSYAVISWWLLGNVTYNLGLAARQKWMVLPFVVVVLIAMSRSYAHERTALRARLRLHKRTVE
ncbi:hypothetical protein FHS89_000555 [Rubricella aquisinus]|uniref:Uncharacterized protein n=1 Tax=Rubricella aquisinus TaxID=2028108 RepID=A0A840X1L0_9RHOB|nr:hypothetical protein [Rubricella aquisinus]MBB5514557.1 hypothetical protein [Rubricella aquisinus]